MEEIPKLTELERLMLMNQYRILASLDESNSYQHTQYADILQRGHVGLYGDMFDSLSEGSSEEDLNEVDDILTMFNFIDNALEALAPEQRQQLDLKKLSFSGFDGNHDKHYSIARFLIEKMDRFQEYAGQQLNSHTSSSLPKYRKMLSVFNKAREGHFGSDLTLEDLQKIAAA
jgi:uncharacterized protein YfbU (UPF0304 family)